MLFDIKIRGQKNTKTHETRKEFEKGDGKVINCLQKKKRIWNFPPP